LAEKRPVFQKKGLVGFIVKIQQALKRGGKRQGINRKVPAGPNERKSVVGKPEKYRRSRAFVERGVSC